MFWVVALLATKVSPRRLTRDPLALAFAVWLGVVTGNRPRAQSVLYLQRSSSVTAAPPCISGRTSYLRVRLEFLRCPQVIPAICNWRGFGPRRGFTRASPCPWEDHSVSGRIPATSALFTLAFAPAPGRFGPLTLRRLYTRRIILQKARHQAWTPSDGLGGQGFRVSFIPLAGVLFTVPSRYSCAIGRPGYIALEGGPPSFPHGSTSRVVLRIPSCRLSL